MPKITNTEIKDIGFTAEMFNKTNETALNTFIDSIITEQSDILEGRIGSTLYASTTTPTSTYVKRAEKCLVAAELLTIRINYIVGNIDGENGSDVVRIRNNIEAYMDKAEEFILKLVSGISVDDGGFAFSAVSSSHFDNDTVLSGLEDNF